MTPAGKLLREAARVEFARLAEKGVGDDDLATAALLLEIEEEPSAAPRGGVYAESLWDRVDRGLALLDNIAHGAQTALKRAGVTRGREAVETLNENLFEFEGFKGDAENYYDPRNSLLTRVIERRRGIPITLSVVYIEIARRAGLTAEGVGLPGHFVARAEGILVDPFAGKIIDRSDCQARLDEMFGGQMPLNEEHLRAVTPREILARMSQNLKGIYAGAQLDADALRVVDRIMLLDPADVTLHRDRGMLLARAGRDSEAAEALRLYLSQTTDEEATEALKRVQARAASLN